MTSAPGISHQYPVEIEAADIDFMGHVNNAIYLKWVHAAVIDYWHALAPPESVASLAWIALRHEITYRRPTFANDSVVATVLLTKIHGAHALYETMIRRGEEILAEVRSSLCCVNAATLRPSPLTPELIEHLHAI